MNTRQFVRKLCGVLRDEGWNPKVRKNEGGGYDLFVYQANVATIKWNRNFDVYRQGMVSAYSVKFSDGFQTEFYSDEITNAYRSIERHYIYKY